LFYITIGSFCSFIFLNPKKYNIEKEEAEFAQGDLALLNSYICCSHQYNLVLLKLTIQPINQITPAA
jgi:hypothetical protein